MDIQSHILVPPNHQLPEYLYRIVPLHRFLEGCQASQNTLVVPDCWEDKHEAIQLRTEIESPLFVDEKGVHSTGLRDNVPRKVGGTMRQGTHAAKNAYAQCWSDLSESDAMWRLYSADNTGVKMRVRPRDLLASLFEATAYPHVFLGLVEYLSSEAHDALSHTAGENYRIQMRSDIFDVVPGDRWAKCLLRKRRPYHHESEYRLIMTRIGTDCKPDAPRLFPYHFDYNKLVSEVGLDPRCEDVGAVQRQIEASGYSGAVNKSRLYEAPKLYIRENWPENDGWSIGSERKWVKREPTEKKIKKIG